MNAVQIESLWAAAEVLLSSGYILEAVQTLDGLVSSDAFPVALTAHEMRTRIRLAEILLSYTTAFDEARRVLEGAAKHYGHGDVDISMRLRVLRGLATCASRKGQPSAAVKYLEEALQVCQKGRDDDWHDTLLVELTVAHIEAKTVSPRLPRPRGSTQIQPLCVARAISLLREDKPHEALETVWGVMSSLQTVAHSDLRILYAACCFASGIYGKDQAATPPIGGDGHEDLTWLNATGRAALHGLLERVRVSRQSNQQSPSKYPVGSTVETFWDIGKLDPATGPWYHARIKKVHADGTYHVEFEDGEENHEVPEEFVRSSHMALRASVSFREVPEHFKVGDRVDAKWMDSEFGWYPAVIIEQCRDGRYKCKYDDSGLKATQESKKIRVAWRTLWETLSALAIAPPWQQPITPPSGRPPKKLTFAAVLEHVSPVTRQVVQQPIEGE